MISADLGPQLETFVTSLVETGRYNSKSEVLREGIRLIQEREARLTVLDQSIARGLADAGQIDQAGRDQRRSHHEDDEQHQHHVDERHHIDLVHGATASAGAGSDRRHG